MNLDASLAGNALSIFANAGMSNPTGSIYDDTLHGGAGDDFLTGGGGADTFAFNQLSGIDHNNDVTTASDQISRPKAIGTGLGAVGTLGSTAFYAAAGDTTGHLATQPKADTFRRPFVKCCGLCNFSLDVTHFANAAIPHNH